MRMAKRVPAEGTRRTRRRRVWLLVILLAGAVIGLALALYPYPPLPVAEVAAARAALTNARREAAKLAPEPLGRAVTAATVMERLYAHDRSRWFRFKRLESLDKAIVDTRSFAEQATAQARSVRTGRLERGRELHEQLDSELASLAPDVQFLPPGERGARSAFARAELALAQAADAARSGDLNLLETSLESAHIEIDVARRALGAQFGRYSNPDLLRRWQGWVDDTVAASRRGGTVAIIVDKRGRKLYLLQGGQITSEYDADLGRNALLNKAWAGDGATPEGRYRVKEKRANGSTRWYKALLLDYPNADDMKAFKAAQKRGEIPSGRGPGGLIEIHGHGGKQTNWTDGCVALQDSEIDRLFKLVPVGTPVTIVGAARRPGGGA